MIQWRHSTWHRVCKWGSRACVADEDVQRAPFEHIAPHFGRARLMWSGACAVVASLMWRDGVGGVEVWRVGEGIRTQLRSWQTFHLQATYIASQRHRVPPLQNAKSTATRAVCPSFSLSVESPVRTLEDQIGKAVDLDDEGPVTSNVRCLGRKEQNAEKR
ncbi:hypothetical protein B0H11DRAFT_1908122 [Mycena galericulata]|nr:hypothetical protein B0H11DRAFT_1908122 [Mycena galericulata]